MPEQANLPGTHPMEAKITGDRMMTTLLETGGGIALDKLLKDLKAAQAQHPTAPGLSIAIALAQRDASVLQLKTTRTVLAAAAKAGLPIESHSIVSELGDDCMVVKAIPGEPT